MKIFRIAQPQPQPTQQMTPQQMESQKNIAEATGEIQSAIALINKSLDALNINRTEELFKKDGIINAIQTGEIRRLDQNRINQSLEAMAAISQSALAINQALRTIEDDGGSEQLNAITAMMVQSLQTGNYSAFQSSMGNFQSNLTGMTGTLQNMVPIL